MRALVLLREQVRPYQLEWRFDSEGQAHPLNDPEWEVIRQELLAPEGSVIIQLAGGAAGVGRTYVDYRGLRCYPLPWPGRERDVSALFIRVPTEYLEERGPKCVHQWALAMAEALPFASGYVSLAWVEGGMEDDAGERVSTRYPGIHLTWEGPDIGVAANVDGVHWMNFLGPPVLGKLGGISGLREHLTLPGISIQELSGDRALVTLGDAPNPGDVDAGETLPMHRALARLLEPHLYRNSRLLGRMTPEDMRRWERRFLD
ncbi:type VI immunity family protein [Pyxidicoccus sp. 3LFB2]